MRGPAKTAVLGVFVCGFLGAGCLDEFLGLVSIDEYEPNDTHAEAAPITDSQAITADFLGDQIDWFMVSTTDDLTFTVACAPTGSIADIIVTLYDDAEGRLADDDDGTADSSAQTIIYPAPDPSGPGNPIDYYIKVEYAGSAEAELYTLTWNTF